MPAGHIHEAGTSRKTAISPAFKRRLLRQPRPLMPPLGPARPIRPPSRNVHAGCAAENVPPAKLETLFGNSYIRLVFTAHPTENRAAFLRLRHKHAGRLPVSRSSSRQAPPSSRTSANLRSPARKRFGSVAHDENIHQFKPSVLDEVVLRPALTPGRCSSIAMPLLRPGAPTALSRQLSGCGTTAGCLSAPLAPGLGSDRDGKPPPHPGHFSLAHACFQRQLMIERYIASVQDLRDQLSISMQLEQVSAPLLESLEIDRSARPTSMKRTSGALPALSPIG